MKPTSQHLKHNLTTTLVQLVYDGSFDGFLTAVFVCYEQQLISIKRPNENIHQQIILKTHHHYVPDMLAYVQTISTNTHKAQRVHSKLSSVLGNDGIRRLLWVFLTEDAQVEACLLGVIHYALCCPNQNILTDFSHPDVLKLSQWLKSVERESHRMKAFVRFEHMHFSQQQTIYFAKIAPDFNVLPLIINHFINRYADQYWAIYDVKRHYGVCYDGKQVTTISDIAPHILTNPTVQHTQEEADYQQLWQGFFTHITVHQRKNLKLHTQNMPRRYWQYLTEKMI